MANNSMNSSEIGMSHSKLGFFIEGKYAEYIE